MRVLLTGANGFIGRRLADALDFAKYEVVCAVRKPAQMRDTRFTWIKADFSRDFDADVWLARLADIDIVINAAGILREQGDQTFDEVHRRAPCALFDACVRAKVKLVVQVSDLGAGDDAASGYCVTKAQADDYLAGLPLQSVIVRPGLVYGAGSHTTRLLNAWACLPLLPVPKGGMLQLQPLHVDDLITAILELLTCALPAGTRIPLAGPEPVTLHDFLATLRKALLLPPPKSLPLPSVVVKALGRTDRWRHAGIRIPAGKGGMAPGLRVDPEPTTYLLGRPARSTAAFIDPDSIPAVRLQAKLDWLLPMLRVCIALVWLISGLLSLLFYPILENQLLLSRFGITGDLALILLYSNAVLDLGIGLATLAMAHRRWLWWLQLGLIGFYTALMTARLPQLWLHPYEPLLMYLPMAGVLWLLLALDDEKGGNSRPQNIFGNEPVQ